jgi:hypothetical protein
LKEKASCAPGECSVIVAIFQKAPSFLEDGCSTQRSVTNYAEATPAPLQNGRGVEAIYAD